MASRALVLSGGGSKGAFELGAVDFLVNDRGLDFDVIAGVSTGSLNALVLAQGAGLRGLQAQVEELKKLWFGIRSANDVYRERFLAKLLVLFAKDSLYSPNPLKAKVQAAVSLDRLRASGKRLRMGSVCLETGDYRTAEETTLEIRDWALASASIPVVFPPVRAGGQTMVDGGVRNLTPLQDAFAALKVSGAPASGGPDEMYVILASPLEIAPDHTSLGSGLQIGKRALAIQMNEVFREDLDYALAINAAVRGYEDLQRQLGQRLGEEDAARFLAPTCFPYRPPKFRFVRIWTIVPERELSEALEFKPEKIRAAFDGGRASAKAPLSEEALQRRLDDHAPRKP